MKSQVAAARIARWFTFKPKSQFGKTFGGPEIGKCFYIFYGHSEYFMDSWDVFWPFGTFRVHLVHFSGFGILYPEKSGNPGYRGSPIR
jgi:hypothetical protein